MTLHLAWMDGKVGADFETTVDISREGREGATAARSQPGSQATEANTAKPQDTVRLQRVQSPGGRKVFRSYGRL